MRSVVRSVLSVFAGFVVASIVMMLVEATNGNILFPELAESARGVTDRAEVREILADAPIGALLVVIGGWILGAVAGGFSAAKMAASARTKHSLVLGCLLTVAGIANNLMIPPPAWFWVASLVVMLPSTFLGGRLAVSGAPSSREQVGA